MLQASCIPREDTAAERCASTSENHLCFFFWWGGEVAVVAPGEGTVGTGAPYLFWK